LITPPTRPASTAGIIQYRPPPAFSRKVRPAAPTSTAVTEFGDARSMYRATPLSALCSVVAEPLPDRDVTHYPSITGPRGYVTEVGINTTGEAVDWLVGLFYGRVRRAGYTSLEQAVAGSPPGAGGLVFAPVLGDGERDDPALRGAVTGLSLRHDRGAVARAALEGIACGVRARLEVLGRTSAPATELRVSGGGAGMAVWNQIKADVTGIPVVRVAGDSTAAGAAMLAGLGAGVYADAAEAVAAGYRPLGRAEPDPARRALYEDLYERYQALTGSQVVR
jgi:sugar (pentulose or hexulose) kinase